jgi:Protein of unknown function (DUF2905)
MVGNGGVMEKTLSDLDSSAQELGATRATARLPGLDIEIVDRPSMGGEAEQLSIHLLAVPSFEAFGLCRERQPNRALDAGCTDGTAPVRGRPGHAVTPPDVAAGGPGSDDAFRRRPGQIELAVKAALRWTAAPSDRARAANPRQGACGQSRAWAPPGDIMFQRGGATFHSVPLVSCIIISIVLSVLFSLPLKGTAPSSFSTALAVDIEPCTQ